MSIVLAGFGFSRLPGKTDQKYHFFIPPTKLSTRVLKPQRSFFSCPKAIFPTQIFVYSLTVQYCSKTQKKSFRRFLNKSFWNHLKKKRRSLPINPARKISIEDGLNAPYLLDEWPFHWKTLTCSRRNSVFEDADFLIFSNISMFGLLTTVSCTVFCQDFHCGNENLIRRSKWWFMTKLHIL